MITIIVSNECKFFNRPDPESSVETRKGLRNVTNDVSYKTLLFMTINEF